MTLPNPTRDSKIVLTLSDDLVVPDTPDPHWQVVDSDGQVYLLDKLKTKAKLKPMGREPFEPGRGAPDAFAWPPSMWRCIRISRKRFL